MPPEKSLSGCEMNDLKQFDYETFIGLSGLDLCHHMEPLVIAPAIQIPEDALKRMLSELPTYDEYHLVYALALGAKYSPATFASKLPQFLVHEQGSVWSTALNSLVQITDKYITNNLIDNLRRVYDAHPQKAWVSDILVKLERRLSTKTDDPL